MSTATPPGSLATSARSPVIQGASRPRAAKASPGPAPARRNGRQAPGSPTFPDHDARDDSPCVCCDIRGSMVAQPDESRGGVVTGGDADLSPELLQRAAGRFGLLASTMRLHIVWVLAHGEMDVGGLADAVGG